MEDSKNTTMKKNLELFPDFFIPIVIDIVRHKAL